MLVCGVEVQAGNIMFACWEVVRDGNIMRRGEGELRGGVTRYTEGVVCGVVVDTILCGVARTGGFTDNVRE